MYLSDTTNRRVKTLTLVVSVLLLVHILAMFYPRPDELEQRIEQLENTLSVILEEL